uniref:Fe/B12 periplasmic-binding domain-containing protein n=1 Tax=candidate division WOR-3 bacterium TaxID=2052148 RepID=A0A7C3N744_UNCW3
MKKVTELLKMGNIDSKLHSNLYTLREVILKRNSMERLKNFSFIFLFFISNFLNAQRIISFAPNITETLFFLSYDRYLVGRTSFCNYPKNTEKIEIAGSFIDIDYEKVVSLKPDIVFFSGNLTDKSEKFLKEKNIKYYDIKMEKIDDITKGIDSIIKIVGKDYDTSKVEKIRNKILGIKKLGKDQKVLIEVSEKPFIIATSSSYIGSILKLFGFKIFEDEKPYINFSYENILSFKPDIVIFMHSFKNGKDKYSILKNFDKIKFVFLDDEKIDIFSRSGPRVIDAIDIIERDFCER